MNKILIILSTLLILSSSLILADEKMPMSNGELEAVSAVQAAKKAGDRERWYRLINETFSSRFEIGGGRANGRTPEQVIVGAQLAMKAEDIGAYYLLVSLYFDMTLKTATTPKQVLDAGFTALYAGDMDVYYFLASRSRDMKVRQGKQKLNTVIPRIATNSASREAEMSREESELISYARAMAGLSPRKRGESALINHARDTLEQEKRKSDESSTVKYLRYKELQRSENNNESPLIKHARQQAMENDY